MRRQPAQLATAVASSAERPWAPLGRGWPACILPRTHWVGVPAVARAGAASAADANGAADNSTSKVTNVCSVVTKANLVAAFGGTWDAKSGYSGPLTCAWDLTGNESSSALAAGSAVEGVLKPGYDATSGMALAQSLRRAGRAGGHPRQHPVHQAGRRRHRDPDHALQREPQGPGHDGRAGEGHLPEILTASAMGVAARLPDGRSGSKRFLEVAQHRDVLSA